MASEIKVDTISEKTAANGVTIDGVLVKDGAIDSSYITGAGKVLQVVIVDGDGTGDEDITGTTFKVTSLVGTITPTSTTSKIIITFTGEVNTQNVSGSSILIRRGQLHMNRNNTASVGSSPNGTNLGQLTFGADLYAATTGLRPQFTNTGIFIDTPSTTSSTTYTLCLAATASNIEMRLHNTDSPTPRLIIQEIAQ